MWTLQPYAHHQVSVCGAHGLQVLRWQWVSAGLFLQPAWASTDEGLPMSWELGEQVPVARSTPTPYGQVPGQHGPLSILSGELGTQQLPVWHLCFAYGRTSGLMHLQKPRMGGGVFPVHS